MIPALRADAGRAFSHEEREVRQLSQGFSANDGLVGKDVVPLQSDSLRRDESRRQRAGPGSDSDKQEEEGTQCCPSRAEQEDSHRGKASSGACAAGLTSITVTLCWNASGASVQECTLLGQLLPRFLWRLPLSGPKPGLSRPPDWEVYCA